MRRARTGSFALLIALALGVAACGAATSGASAKSSAATAMGGVVTSHAHATGLRAAAPVSAGAARDQSQTIGATVTPATADIVRNGSLLLALRTPADLRSSYTAITDLAVGAGGFVADSTLTNGRHPSASITLRVPDGQVGTVIARIGAMGRVRHQTLSGQDVTGEVVDLSVEITNLTSEEAAVRHLLTDAGTVRNILSVQEQLFDLQDEIQQLTAQSNSLHNRIQYATLAVALSTTAVAVPTIHHHTATVARFWNLARTHTVSVVRGVFLAIGWSAPGLVALAVIGGAVIVVRRRRFAPTPAGAGTDDA